MEATSSARKPYQAGRFYPADPDELRSVISHYMNSFQSECANLADGPSETSIGFLAPHAGYSFSGAVAGCSYNRLMKAEPQVIFVIAPSHHAAFPLASVWEGSSYSTPLGEYEIDRDMVALLHKRIPGMNCKKYAEEVEHSLEVQVPFLQLACPNAKMVPLLMGIQDKKNARILAEGISAACEGMAPGQVAFVASSDAYHGHSLDICRRSDAALCHLIEEINTDGLFRSIESGDTMACGYGPLAVVMEVSRALGAKKGTVLKQAASADVIPYRNGDYVVGYVAAEFC